MILEVLSLVIPALRPTPARPHLVQSTSRRTLLKRFLPAWPPIQWWPPVHRSPPGLQHQSVPQELSPSWGVRVPWSVCPELTVTSMESWSTPGSSWVPSRRNKESPWLWVKITIKEQNLTDLYYQPCVNSARGNNVDVCCRDPNYKDPWPEMNTKKNSKTVVKKPPGQPNIAINQRVSSPQKPLNNRNQPLGYGR